MITLKSMFHHFLSRPSIFILSARGLCCNGDYFYICDGGNKRIQILTLDFEYVNTSQLDGDYPYTIQISNTTIGVSCHHATFF